MIAKPRSERPAPGGQTARHVPLVSRLVQCLLALGAFGALALASGCGDSGTGPTSPAVVVASVDVTSPIGALLNVGGNAQLTATAKDADGKPTGGSSTTWSSSNPGVVSVSASGAIAALKAGTATIHAVVEGVSGSLALRVVNADVPGITALATDAYVTKLVGGVSSALRPRVQAALGNCTGGASAGDLENVEACVDSLDADASAATDATDRAVLAVLTLFAGEIEQRLNL